MASLVLTDSSQLTSDSQHSGIYSSPVASLVLTDSSQLTSDTFELNTTNALADYATEAGTKLFTPCNLFREEPVRQHLKNVYACLTMSTIAASVGAYVHVFTQLLSAGFLTVIGSMGLLVALMATPDNGKNRKLRLGYLLGFAFFTGLGMGPLLEMVIQVDPSIIVTALIGTVVIFVSFTLSSLMAERGRWLYLGGTLMSLLSALLVLSLANLFIGSYLIFQVSR
uniref:Bax inhibitor 1 n=1 Tax=Timema cristinae TaxID=61476 RepID=A0A7R9H3U9_TIMCR|nr:unnamed protein product [Timema cristinae]